MVAVLFVMSSRPASIATCTRLHSEGDWGCAFGQPNPTHSCNKTQHLLEHINHNLNIHYVLGIMSSLLHQFFLRGLCMASVGAAVHRLYPL